MILSSVSPTTLLPTNWHLVPPVTLACGLLNRSLSPSTNPVARSPAAAGQMMVSTWLSEQGVIEGGENNEVTYSDLKHYEVAPYFSYTNHLMIPDLIVINEKLYNGMSQENRKIFDRLMHETIEKEFLAWNKNVEKAKEIAIENGATFVNIDIKPFQKNIEPLQETVKNHSDVTRGIYKKVRELAN